MFFFALFNEAPFFALCSNELHQNVSIYHIVTPLSRGNRTYLACFSEICVVTLRIKVIIKSSTRRERMKRWEPTGRRVRNGELPVENGVGSAQEAIYGGERGNVDDFGFHSRRKKTVLGVDRRIRRNENQKTILLFPDDVRRVGDE